MKMITRKLIYQSSDGLPCRRRQTALLLGCVLFLGSLVLQSTIAQAIPVSIDTTYQNAGLGITVDTVAIFNTDPLTNTGTEQIQIDQFTLLFSDRGFSQSANIVPNLSPPFPEATLVAQFIDGAFDQFISINTGGNTFIQINPFVNNLVAESIALGLNALSRIAGGPAVDFGLVSRSGPTPLNGSTSVPEPGTLALFCIGIVGLGVMVRQRRTV